MKRSRDLGHGPARRQPGPGRASAFLASPVGLVLRLQRGSLIGWLLGAVVAGVFFGGVAQAMTTCLDPANPFAKAFVGTSNSMLDGVLGLFVMFNGLLAGAFAVQCLAGRTRRGGRRAAGIASLPARSPATSGCSPSCSLPPSVPPLMLLMGGYLTGASSNGAATARPAWPRHRLPTGRRCCS